MKIACQSISEMCRKRYSKNKQISEDPALPIEWLHPKEGHHINSIDSLMYHEDLVQNYLKDSTRSSRVPRGGGREIIEKALFEKNICKWDGVVSEVMNDWKGTICFKKRIFVPFVPVNVQHGMPCEGERVRFCIAFHWSGPRAYYVVSEPGSEKSRKALSRPLTNLAQNSDEGEVESQGESEGDDDEEGLDPLVRPLHRRDIKSRPVLDQQEHVNGWDQHLGEEMQGVVFQRYPAKGYGLIQHPNVEGQLFFHAKQMDPPVESLDVIDLQTVVSFTVEKTGTRTRAINIKIVVSFLYRTGEFNMSLAMFAFVFSVQAFLLLLC